MTTPSGGPYHALVPMSVPMGVVLRSLLLWFVVTLSVLVFGGLVILCAPFVVPFDRRRRLLLRIMRSWGLMLVRLNPLWGVAVEGLARIDPQATYVVTSKHQSNADVIVLSYLSLLYVYMSKRAIFRIPILGWGDAGHRLHPARARRQNKRTGGHGARG